MEALAKAGARLAVVQHDARNESVRLGPAKFAQSAEVVGPDRRPRLDFDTRQGAAATFDDDVNFLLVLVPIMEERELESMARRLQLLEYERLKKLAEQFAVRQ